MNIKFFKGLTSVLLAMIMVFGCIGVGFATTDDNIKPGELVVVLSEDIPINELLPEFEVLKVVPVYEVCNWTVLRYPYLIYFREKTTDVVLRAMDVLKDNPYVLSIEPTYIKASQNVTEPVTETIAETTEQPTSTVPEETANPPVEFPRVVLVDYTGFYSIGSILDGFDVKKISYLGRFHSDSDDLIHTECEIFFSDDETEENILKAIEILRSTEGVCRVELGGNCFDNIITPKDPKNFTKGDADGDGRLTVRDATCIQKYLAGLISSDKINLQEADITGTGSVTISDATLIQRELVGALS